MKEERSEWIHKSWQEKPSSNIRKKALTYTIPVALAPATASATARAPNNGNIVLSVVSVDASSGSLVVAASNELAILLLALSSSSFLLSIVKLMKSIRFPIFSSVSSTVSCWKKEDSNGGEVVLIATPLPLLLVLTLFSSSLLLVPSSSMVPKKGSCHLLPTNNSVCRFFSRDR